MITGALRSQVDQVWNAFWSGGIANPLTVIEQITYLLFAKRLDELQTAHERRANRLGGRNAHVHYLLATREVTQDGFGAVNREWARPALLREWRMEWQASMELALER